MEAAYPISLTGITATALRKKIAAFQELYGHHRLELSGTFRCSDGELLFARRTRVRYASKGFFGQDGEGAFRVRLADQTHPDQLLFLSAVEV